MINFIVCCVSHDRLKCVFYIIYRASCVSIGAFVGDVTSLCVAHYAVHIKPKVGHSFSLNTLIAPINILK